ncbi:carbon storage regulator [Planctomicrobium sp. SH668]|uniref:carbon storage regulator n=1 Tax=Planctomicrobium sp. SH668 TaxID=3448126 RepID=UPI003F5B730E
MLVLSRKNEEFIQIGSDIVIKIIKSSNGSVKIGIDAPGNLRVLRGELQEERLPMAKPISRQRFSEISEAKIPQIAEVI